MTRSNLQRQVLQFYKECLRQIQQGKQKEYRGNWYSFVRDQFERNRRISRVNITEIEYMLRLGKKSFDQMKSDSCKNVTPKRQWKGIWVTHMERRGSIAHADKKI